MKPEEGDRIEKKVGEDVDDARLARVLETYLAEVEAGRSPDADRLIAEHPEIADRLRTCLSTLQFVEQAAFPETVSARAEVEGEAPSHEIGDYRIVGEIGRGGMGIVYEAEQISLGRKVALKVLPFAAVLDRKQVQRFKTEAQAAAQLHHTNIVPVFSVGCERGVHYYAMQYIDGQPLHKVIRELRHLSGLETENWMPSTLRPSRESAALTSGRLRCREPDRHEGSSLEPSAADLASTPLGIQSSTHSREFFRSVATLGVQAAEALEHAHSMGVIHRDVKPANLILDAHGHIWITDFGLAHVRSDSSLTLSGDLLGTLRYMSPEQAMAKRMMVDHRTDIYSLGTTLYELLTLEPAITGENREEILRKVVLEEPKPIRKVNRTIPVEIETIILKATEKNPVGRYATAQAMADDFRRYLEDKPIRAKRPTLVDRAVKWARRHRAVVWAALAVLVITTIGSAMGTLLVSRAYHRASQERDAAYQNLYLAHMRLAHEDWKAGQTTRLLGLLKSHLPQSGRPDLRGWEWYYLLSLAHSELRTFRGHGAAVTSVAWSPDGERVASSSEDETVKIWSVEAGKELRTLRGHDDYVYGVAWSPDGAHLASVGRDLAVKIWAADSGEEVRTLRGHTDEVYCVAWSPEGKLLATGSADCSVKIWSADSGTEVRTLRGHMSSVAMVAWAPDGKHLASGNSGQSGTLKIWDVPTARAVISWRAHAYMPTKFAWSPEGERLVSGGPTGDLKIWDAYRGRELVTIRTYETRSVDWSADEGYLASGSEDQGITIWSLETGKEVQTLLAHTGPVNTVVWNPAGTRLASGSEDGTVKLWMARGSAAEKDLNHVPDSQLWLAWSPKGDRLASVGWNWTAKIWDVSSGNLLRTLPGVPRIAWHPGGRMLATGMWGRVLIQDANTGRKIQSLEMIEEETNRKLDWSADGSRLAAASGNRIEIWEVSTWSRVLTLDGHDGPIGEVAWSPNRQNRQLLASAGFDGTARIWNGATGESMQTFRHGPMQSAATVCWSPDGRRFASAGRAIKVWDVETAQELFSSIGHLRLVQMVAWSPDGKRLATAATDGLVKVWTADTGHEVMTLHGPPERVNSVRWSPDGTHLAAGYLLGVVRIWDASAGYGLERSPSDMPGPGREHLSQPPRLPSQESSKPSTQPAEIPRIPHQAAELVDEARALEESGRLKDARERLWEAAAYSESRRVFVMNLWELGRFHERRGESDRALELYERAAEIDPDLLGILSHGGNASRKNKLFARAIEAELKSLAICPAGGEVSPSSFLNLWASLLEEDPVTDFGPQLETILRTMEEIWLKRAQRPNWILMTLALGWANHPERKNLEKALQYARAAAENCKEGDYHAFIVLSDVLSIAGDPEEAERVLRAKIEQTPAAERELLDGWLALSFRDLRRTPSDCLAQFPRSESEHADHCRWLLEKLQSGETIRINCGRHEYRDSGGNLWVKDRFFRGGLPAGGPDMPVDFEGTKEHTLYRTTRVFQSSTTRNGYVVPLPVGEYRLTLYNAEHFCGGIKECTRRFSVRVEGVLKLVDYQVPFHKADPKTYAVLVEDGALDIDFIHGSAQLPEINAIEIEPIRG